MVASYMYVTDYNNEYLFDEQKAESGFVISVQHKNNYRNWAQSLNGYFVYSRRVLYMSKRVLYPSKQKPNDNPRSYLLFCVVIIFSFSL